MKKYKIHVMSEQETETLYVLTGMTSCYMCALHGPANSCHDALNKQFQTNGTCWDLAATQIDELDMQTKEYYWILEGDM